ncbi:electron transfer flavoprotein subunit alpha [bacterium]|nr:electron transfer flavoprotein subunit alpha [bacterium]
MERILLLIHPEADGSLPKSALEALGAAAALSKEASRSVWLSERATGGGFVATCGAQRFLGVVGEQFAQARYASDAAAAEALIKTSQATVVLAPATSRWSRVLAGVAQRVGGRIDTHVTALEAEEGRLCATRWYYRQRMFARITRGHRPWMLTLEPGIAPPWQGAAGSAQVENVAVALPDAMRRTTVSGVQAPAADQQTIRPDADLLFVAGAGWTKNQKDGKSHVDEAAKLILGFLRASKASLGSSKSLVDLAGEGQAVLPFMSHLNQVGQTGATPRHPKGLSTCCHGEEPHVVGWRFISERRAVNLDPNCGWAQGKADVLYVADAFEVMAKVNERL